jgi:hypothetical protein
MPEPESTTSLVGSPAAAQAENGGTGRLGRRTSSTLAVGNLVKAEEDAVEVTSLPGHMAEVCEMPGPAVICTEVLHRYPGSPANIVRLVIAPGIRCSADVRLGAGASGADVTEVGRGG